MPADAHPHDIHRCAQIFHLQSSALSDDGVASIGTNCQRCPYFQRALRRACAHANNGVALFDEIGDLSLHLQMKRRVASAMLCDEVEKVPLRHECEKTAVGRKMREIRNHDWILSDLPTQFGYLLMRTFQEFVQNAKLIHDFES